MLKNRNFSLFFKINLFITILIFMVFLFFNNTYTYLSFAVTLLGIISTAVTLYIILYLLLFIFSGTKKFGLYLSALLFIVTDLALVVDLFIYKLFHFHINAMVLNILTSPDAMDSIQTGVMPLVVVVVMIVIFVLFELYLMKKILKVEEGYKRELNSRLNRFMVIPIALLIVTEKVSYGMASLFSKNEIISKFKVVPLYQPLTFTKVAARYFGFKAEEQAKYSIKTTADLNYPLKPLKIEKQKEKFNIFIIAMDALKYSILDENLTPNINALAKDSLVFKEHYSGGDATRFGIFSLMYGLNSTYWFSFLNSNQKPLLFDVLKELNYKIDIFSSTNTNWPEFRKTCYVDIQDSIHDNFEGLPWKKDEQNTALFLKSFEENSSSKQRFSFIFLDSPHGYSYPESYNLYGVEKSDINYMAISEGSDELKKTVKRYKNAVNYNDMLVGKMIAKFKEKNLYDNSLIIFTSDHGQEFYEQGNFGHNTSFSKGQTHVPFFIKLPKSLEDKGLKEKKGELSSHQDVVPTLLTLLGVTNLPKEYSNGKNLFAKNFHREYVFSANWTDSAVITKELTYVFSNLPNKMFNNQIRDSRTYKKLKGEKSNSKLILDTIDENRKFLK